MLDKKCKKGQVTRTYFFLFPPGPQIDPRLFLEPHWNLPPLIIYDQFEFLFHKRETGWALVGIDKISFKIAFLTNFMIKIALLFVTEFFLEAEDWVSDFSRSDSSEEISGISSGSSTSSESSLEEGSFTVSFSATGVSQSLVLDLGPGLVFDFGPGLYPLTPAPAFGEIKIIY